MIKTLTAALAATTISAIAAASIVSAEPSDGRDYGRCKIGQEWSHSLKKCR